jgi:RNA-directed DNA polymerase
MNDQDLLMEEARLYDHRCETAWWRAGFEQVKKNRGAPGIDRVTIADFEAGLDVELRRLQEELGKSTGRGAAAERSTTTPAEP